MINPVGAKTCQSRLHVESRTLRIIADAFSQVTNTGYAQPEPHSLVPIERQPLKRAEKLLAVDGRPISVDAIAANVGVGVNTLQRLFDTAHGMTVFHYVRKIKLDQARVALETDKLTISQAAFVAGYPSAANFATAFREVFGFSAKDARTR